MVYAADGAPSECPGGTCGGGLWGMDVIRAPAAWGSLPSVGGRTYRGGVVDSGVWHDHPDLLGQTNKALSMSQTLGSGGYDVMGHGAVSAVTSSLHGRQHA
jgi:hypothetical protein